MGVLDLISRHGGFRDAVDCMPFVPDLAGTCFARLTISTKAGSDVEHILNHSACLRMGWFKGHERWSVRWVGPQWGAFSQHPGDSLGVWVSPLWGEVAWCWGQLQWACSSLQPCWLHAFSLIFFLSEMWAGSLSMLLSEKPPSDTISAISEVISTISEGPDSSPNPETYQTDNPLSNPSHALDQVSKPSASDYLQRCQGWYAWQLMARGLRVDGWLERGVLDGGQVVRCLSLTVTSWLCNKHQT